MIKVYDLELPVLTGLYGEMEHDNVTYVTESS